MSEDKRLPKNKDLSKKENKKNAKAICWKRYDSERKDVGRIQKV